MNNEDGSEEEQQFLNVLEKIATKEIGYEEIPS